MENLNEIQVKGITVVTPKNDAEISSKLHKIIHTSMSSHSISTTLKGGNKFRCGVYANGQMIAITTRKSHASRMAKFPEMLQFLHAYQDMLLSKSGTEGMLYKQLSNFLAEL